jgi:nucleoside-diphosphate-sugar epimerase
VPDPDRPLVTVLGASGFVGTAVARELAARPIRLRLVARREVNAPAGALAEIESHPADLTAPGAMAAAVDGADAVVHLLAYIKGASHWRVSEGDDAAERVNVGLLRDLVDAVRTAGTKPAVLFAGAVSEVGTAAGERVLGDEDDRPASEYDRHKLAAETALRAAHAEGVLRGVTLRLPTVYGRGTDPAAPERGVVAAMMRKALAGEPLTMWNDGTVARDLVCVDDIARAFAAGLDHADALAGRHWLLGSGIPVPVGELFNRIAEAVADATGTPPVPVRRVVPEHADPADGLGFVVGSTAFGDVTGWAPQVPLEDGLREAARFRAAELAAAAR